MAKKSNPFQVTVWSGSQHPSLSAIVKLLKDQNYRPYSWENTPNYRYLTRSHNYHKILYVVEGTLEVTFPDENQIIKLKIGDRVDINANTRHGIHVGANGVKCVEVAVAKS
jgi:mannose-6-phosphate isomerase-like protein (cupin superfamily)